MKEPFTQEDLNNVVDEFQAQSADLLRKKGGEYATDDDRLKNFRQVADLIGLDPEAVCMTYLLKHMQSLSQSIQTGDRPWAWRDEDGGEALKQRIADAINYLYLLAAILEHNQQEDPE